jgi:spermidine synthase
MAKPDLLRKLLVAGFFLSGIASMIYEVVWFRELSLVIGTTVYAFSAMLTSFLAGLSLGSYVTSRRADVHGNVIRLFALLEVGIGLYGLVSLPLFRAIGLPYAHLFALFQDNIYAIALCQFVMSFFVMIVPTARLGGSIGSLYAANSWGCVLGAYASGFILMPIIEY